MDIRILSDVHNEFGILHVPHMSGEEHMVCVLAGDIGVAKQKSTYVDFVNDMADRHRHVIYIPGNHEYYNGSINRAVSKIQENIGDRDNVSIFEHGVVEIDNVVFVCATLWTDMNRGDPMMMLEAQQVMNDYRKIRIGPSVADGYKRKFKPEDAVALHIKHKRFLFDEVKKAKAEGKKVVCVSHHAPTELSVSEKFHGNRLNGAYHSNLEYNIVDSNPDVWVHGHTHVAFDYMLDDTRIMCNPRGYVSMENVEGFDPTKVVSV